MKMKKILLAVCLIWMAKAQQQCRTVNTQQTCIFPFTYKGITYNGCTFAGNSNRPWCALDSRATKWEDCEDSCPIANGGNGNVANKQGWTKWGNWGQCSGACGVGNGVEDRRRSCQGGNCNGDSVETRSCTTLDRCIGNNGNQDPCTLDRSNCIGSNNGNNINNGNNGNTNRDCYTTGGPQRNQLCVFPFFHGSLQYHDCTRAGHKEGKLWCSTKVDSTGRHIDGQGFFGTCSGHCFGNAAGANSQVWNNWSNWGQCSGGNGGNNGVSERRRACKGTNCRGKTVETRSCSNSGCSCSDFMNTNGYGQCKKSNSRFGGAVTCYVNLPSTCTDRLESGSNRGKWSSSEACRINSVGSGASGRCVTNAGPAGGQPCVFPFKYAGKTHTSCGTWRWRGQNQGKRWCSTRTQSNGNHISKSGNYGFCPNTPICNGNGGGNNGNGGGNGAPQVGNSGGFVIKNANVISTNNAPQVGTRNFGQEDQDGDVAPQ